MAEQRSNEIQIRTDEQSLQATIDDFLNLVEEIPWGNSDWQNKQAIINMELTPERAYRHASLRIINRLQAINESYYAIKKDSIQIERLQRKKIRLSEFKNQIDNPDSDLDKEAAEIEIEQILSRRTYQQKLIKDAINEVKSLAPIIQSIGKLSKEQFENAEANHFELKYKNQIMGKPEALLGLEAMGLDTKSGKFIEDFKTLYDKITKESVKQLKE